MLIIPFLTRMLLRADYDLENVWNEDNDDDNGYMMASSSPFLNCAWPTVRQAFRTLAPICLATLLQTLVKTKFCEHTFIYNMDYLYLTMS